MLAALIVTLMLDCVGSSAMCSTPSNSPKRPLTLATIRCRTSNTTVVCAGSSTHVPALGNWTPFQVRHGAPGAPRRPAPVPFPPGFGHDAGMSELHFPRHEYYMRLALREAQRAAKHGDVPVGAVVVLDGCLLYTSDAADEEDSVDLGGRR